MTFQPAALEAWNEALHAKPGSVFATPDQFRDVVHQNRVRGLVKLVLVEALADAADADGVLADFDQEEFFTAHLAPELADTDAGEQFIAASTTGSPRWR
ncbi:hypothetical protein [Actinokineospora terrae]|uniref:Uncharacterized protein n=1 Tax=Actinokineospora terrae TaxID=155974 RepID=A0A1H9XRJ7_9PSEU|nr:hypothetical protein [Actinokineospora terrae]SES48762.1 hypothetical protein SAMN04487818_1228 [Actinokineospora terrae]